MEILLMGMKISEPVTFRSLPQVLYSKLLYPENPLKQISKTAHQPRVHIHNTDFFLNTELENRQRVICANKDMYCKFI